MIKNVYDFIWLKSHVYYEEEREYLFGDLRAKVLFVGNATLR